MTKSAIVVGSGLSGLTCARALHREDLNLTVLEASDRIGGRVQTDEVDGFLLDRGFQVLLDSYPEARRHLDFSALDLKPFRPGAIVRKGRRLHRVADPLRSPLDALPSLLAPVGTFRDKLLTARLRLDVAKDDGGGRFRRDMSTRAALERYGFSKQMMQSFFRPFLGGVFLENGLETSAAKFAFVFGMFATGRATVPSAGMRQIPAQLARGYEDRIRTGCPVARVEQGRVTLASGEVLEADAIVLAVDEASAAKLAGSLPPENSKSTITLYFESPTPPVRGPWLVLNGDMDGVVTHLAVMSEVSSRYAPEGKTLVSVTVVDADNLTKVELANHVRQELESWFGAAVRDWLHIRSYHIANALPDQKNFSSTPRVRKLSKGVWQCGDYLGNASIEGAMLSGRLTAEAILGARDA